MKPPDGDPQSEVTALLLAWSAGAEDAMDRLAPIVQEELKRIARRYMLRERKDHTLQPTALVNEAFLRLVDARGVAWQDRAHFFALAAKMMRRILVNYALARASSKRGGSHRKVTFDEAVMVGPGGESQLVALDETLEMLARFDQRKAQVVELRFFGGLSVEETAQVLHVSEQTVLRDWSIAKSWLAREIERSSA
ncbi:MAG: sigma-70 family RNA polymerase sigma factor [Bryobacteraceae bacterium]